MNIDLDRKDDRGQERMCAYHIICIVKIKKNFFILCLHM